MSKNRLEMNFNISEGMPSTLQQEIDTFDKKMKEINKAKNNASRKKDIETKYKLHDLKSHQCRLLAAKSLLLQGLSEDAFKEIWSRHPLKKEFLSCYDISSNGFNLIFTNLSENIQEIINIKPGKKIHNFMKNLPNIANQNELLKNIQELEKFASSCYANTELSNSKKNPPTYTSIYIASLPSDLFEIAISFQEMTQFYDAYKINHHQFFSALSKYATKENKSIFKNKWENHSKSFKKLLNNADFMQFQVQSKLSINPQDLKPSRVESWLNEEALFFRKHKALVINNGTAINISNVNEFNI